MKRLAWLYFSLLFISVLSYGCARSEPGVERTEDEVAAVTATAEANLSALPEDIPVYANAEKLKFAAGNTYFTYEVPGTVDEVVEFYRTELQALGWEKKNNSSEEPLGGSLTLLRSKSDKNVSVTIQGIPESEYVRVLISIILK